MLAIGLGIDMETIFDLKITELNNSPTTLFDQLYLYFNWFEAVGWFCFACYIWLRFLKFRRTPLELIYGLYFCIFGVTDVLEVYRLTLGLFATKAIVLLSILVCRHYVLQSYPDRKFKL